MARNSLADNSPEGARRLGALTERPKTVRGSLGVSSDGTLDIDDFYSFRLGRRSRIDIRLSGLQSDASLRILRGNDVIATSNRRGTRNERIRRNLNAGTFFIRVSQDNRDTRYVLRALAGEATNGGGNGGGNGGNGGNGGGTIDFPNLLTPDRDPGNIPATAFNDTRQLSVRSFANAVGGEDDNGNRDSADFYRFTVARSNRVTITTGNVSGGTVETSLIYDVNGNGVVDRGDRPDTVDVIATGSPITKALGAGTYFVGITPVTVTGDEVSYNFKIEETAITGIRTGTDAPIGLGGAVDLTPGTDLVSAVRQRGGTFNLRQVLGVSDTNNSQLVGTFESTDIYRFTLTSEVNTFSALLNTSGLTGDLTMSLIYDENGNGIANPGTVGENGLVTLGDFPGGVFTEGGAGGAALAINKTLGAGTYYLAITQRNEIVDNTTYSIDLFANSVGGISAIGDQTNNAINSFSSAFNVGTLNQNVSYRQFVGNVDTSDLYTFTLNRPRNIIIRYSGSPELAGIRFGTDYNGNGFFDPFEDVNNNRILDPGEDLNGNGVLDFAEDINGDGLLNPGEDVNGNNRLDAAEDANNNGILDGGEDINGNGILDRDVFEPSLVGNVVYSPLPPFFAGDASFNPVIDTFLTPGIATDIYARLPAGTYVVEVNRQTIQTDLGDGLTRYGAANILYNLSFLLDG